METAKDDVVVMPKELTLRDYIAAQALSYVTRDFEDTATLARHCYYIADVFLRERLRGHK